MNWWWIIAVYLLIGIPFGIVMFFACGGFAGEPIVSLIGMVLLAIIAWPVLLVNMLALWVGG